MRDTAQLLYESNNSFSSLSLTEFGDNANQFNSISVLESRHQDLIDLLGITPEKVIVNVTPGNNYMIEFAGNLERLIDDQNVSFQDAIALVAEENHINNLDSIYIVVDESSIPKINFRKAKYEGIKILRKK